MSAVRWKAGWYLIDAELDAPVTGSRLIIRLDFGSGTGLAAESFVMPIDTGGSMRLRLVFPLRRPASDIEFLADDEILRNGLLESDPQPVSKWAAVWRLLASRPGRAPAAGVGGVLKAGWNSIRIVIGSRSSSIGDSAWRSYLRGNTSEYERLPYAPLRLRRTTFGLSRNRRLVPASQLERVVSELGGVSWQCTGNDPQFVTDGNGARFRAGWYWFECRVVDPKCRIIAPCIYPDYGNGHAQADMIALPEPDSTGWIRALVLLTHDAGSLRFDPTASATQFDLHGCRLSRISRLRVLWHLVRERGEEGRVDWRATRAASSDFLRALRTQGLQRTVRQWHDRLRRRYEPTEPEYRRWVLTYDTLTVGDLARLRELAAGDVDGPLISILLPVYQTPEKWLRRCLDSVLDQVYPKWELCIADDASTLPHVREVLDEYAAKEDRIRVTYRVGNGHISESSNTALNSARGDFVALLDHDDELPPHALYEVACAIRDNPGWQVIYTDEDKIDEGGQRCDAYFKSDWNYDLLLSQNCLSHLGIYRTDLVREVGGFRRGYEGSQDHDLALRCIERLESGQIGHIPKVLYHWRKIAGSTAIGASEKNYAAEAGRMAISDHLRRTGVDGAVEVTLGGYYRVRYELPDPPPKVSLIIPTRDRAGLLDMCVRSILDRTEYPDFEILIVDNQSTESETFALFDELRTLPNVKVLPYDRPFNYSAINNHAARHAEGHVLALVNNDIEVRDGGWLMEMVSHACRRGVGAVGCLLYYPDDTIQHAGVITGLHGVAGHIAVGQKRGDPGYFGRSRLVQNMSAVTAACMVVRKQAFEQVGGLDEGLAVAFNDVDFCLRLQEAGYRNVWTPHAWAYHHESASRGAEDTPEKRARFQNEVKFMEGRWGEKLMRDPAYSQNLTLTDYPFRIAFPPRDQVHAGE